MNNFSKLGFVLATLGSSIGLGHIWRFPYMTGENGGSAFVLIYILLTIIVGVPILIAKMVIGNKTQTNPIRAFKEFDSSVNKYWKKIGIMVIGGPLILTLYAVVLGWVFYYLTIVSFNLPKNIEDSNNIFKTLISDDILVSIISFTACVIMTGVIVARGIKRGIERFNLILMPLLFVIFIGLFFYTLSLPSFSKAVNFLLAFDITKINSNVVIMALSQVFFSLSIGLGTIISYSSSAKKGENLLTSALWVAFSGIVISIIAGLVIFALLFNYGQSPNEGTGMLFKSLPIAFGSMPYGSIVSVLFFAAVLFAGITSSISMLEPMTSCIATEYNISRRKVVTILCLIIFVIGVINILSYSNKFGSTFTYFDKPFFDWIDFITSGIIMPLGGLAAMMFLTYAINTKRIYKFCSKFMSKFTFKLWYLSITFIAPIVIVAILYEKFIDTFFKDSNLSLQSLFTHIHIYILKIFS